MNYYLYIDDIREDLSFCDTLPLVDDKHWDPVLLRSYQEVEDFLINCYDCENDTIFLDLDHDLGEFDANNNEKTGYDICKLIINSSPIWIYGFHIHSMNPVGAQNMRQLLTHYGCKEY